MTQVRKREDLNAAEDIVKGKLVHCWWKYKRMPTFWRVIRPNASRFLICGVKDLKNVVIVGIITLLLEIGSKEISET